MTVSGRFTSQVSQRLRRRRDERKRSGHTRWRRFAAAMALGGLASGALLFGMTQGAIAASFAASGTSFKVNAAQLDGDGLTMFGSEVNSSDGAKEAATMAVKTSDITDFCTSFTVAKLPALGNISIGLKAENAEGEELILAVDEVDAGTMDLTNARLGIDASNVGGTKGTTGLDASSMSASDLKGESWSLSAGTLNAKSLNLSAVVGDKDNCK